MTNQTVRVLFLIAMVFLAGCSGSLPLVYEDTQDAEEDLYFHEVAAERGFNYTPNLAVDFGGRSGVYTTDFNNDQWTDVLAVGGEDPALFENTGGEFEQTVALPSVDIAVKSALFFDYDNDGWEDLLLLPVNGTAVFLKNQNGTFHEQDVGLDRPMQMARASVADYNQDGCLDLFIAQSGDWRDGVPKAALPSYSREDALLNDSGQVNLLYEGDCESFERVKDAGIEGTRWSLVTSFVDLTGNSYPDIHVGNDFNVDILYVNQADGTFERVEIPDTKRHAMSSEVADVTGNGDLDIFVSNVHFEEQIRLQGKMPSMDNQGNNLLINHGNGTFTTEEHAFGVRDGSWGWAAAIVDLNNDGRLDLVHTTKNVLLEANETGLIEKIETYPHIWQRTTENFTRLNASEVGFETSSGRGMVHLDYNQNGRQDLILATAVDDFKLYENRGPDSNWLQISVGGNGVPALGSDVHVTTDNGTQYQVVNAHSDFLSQNTRTLHFGLDDHESATVHVMWPDGTERTLESVNANQRLMISPEGLVEAETHRQSITGDNASG